MKGLVYVPALINLMKQTQPALLILSDIHMSLGCVPGASATLATRFGWAAHQTKIKFHLA